MALTTSSSWVMSTMVIPEAAVDVGKQRQHRLVVWIQGTGRLVTEQVARIGGQGAGDAHSLLLPPTTGKGATVLAKPHQFQQLADPGRPLRRATPAISSGTATFSSTLRACSRLKC